MFIKAAFNSTDYFAGREEMLNTWQIYLMGAEVRKILMCTIFVLLASCGEQETMYSKCFNKEVTKVPNTEFVSKVYDKDLAKKFKADLFVKTVDEAKAELYVDWKAYRDNPDDEFWYTKAEPYKSEVRMEKDKYIFSKSYKIDFLEQNLPTMYEALTESYFYKQLVIKPETFRLVDLFDALILLERDEPWEDAGLPDVPYYKLTSAQFDKLPLKEWHKEDLNAFYKLKEYLSPLINDARDDEKLAKQISHKYAENLCNERGLYE